MYTTKAFQKRLNRRIIGPEKIFFAVSIPGFEPVCNKELTTLSPDFHPPNLIKGGVEFTGRLSDCYAASLHLRTATRILMRIDNFPCTNFRQLEKKTATIPWELYFWGDSSIDIRVSTSHSRLYHSEAIAQRVGAIVNNRIKEEGVTSDKSIPQILLLRMYEDQLMISVDCSGEALYKRGLKAHSVTAPIRETHAALALMVGGYTGTEPLIDPMAGSGSFTLEAAMMAKQIPPGYYRIFSFMGWPAFRAKQWEYLKNKATQGILHHEAPKVFASDTDAEACDAIDACIRTNALADVARVQHRDFFDLDPGQITRKKGMVVINPPYGRRMGSRKESRQLHKQIFRKLDMDYKGWKLALFTPFKFGRDEIPFKVRSTPILHGGLPVHLLTGRIY